MRFTVSPAATDDHAAACRLLFARPTDPAGNHRADRCREMLASGEFDPAGLFVAHDRAGAVVGAALVQALPGAIGLAWPPRAEPGPDRLAVEDAVAAAGCAWLRGRGTKVCQAFAAGWDRTAAAPLERHGFRHVTQLCHLRRDVRATDPDGPPLVLRPFAADPDGFTETLLLTYDGSLDCPELTGDRTPAELVDGFRGSGPAGGRWWFMVECDGRPAGVVMWEPGTEPGVMELAYLGVVPAVRGRGLGDALVRESVRFARDAGCHALDLSVDARNEPALRLYHRHAFRAVDRREVFLAAWPG